MSMLPNRRRGLQACHNSTYTRTSRCCQPLAGKALELDAAQHFRRDIARWVLAGEARRAESLELRVALLNRLDQVLEGLVEDVIRTDLVRYLFGNLAAGDELVLGRHVDAIEAWVAQGRGVGGKEDLPRACVPGNTDDLPRGVAADDRIVDQQDVLALEFERDRVQLLAHRALALRLVGHDEGTADVAILDKSLAVLDTQL